MSKSAYLILAPGFEEIEAVTIMDVLRRAGVNLQIIGLDTLAVTGSHDITIQAEERLANVTDTPDAVILPGGMPGSNHLAESPAVEALVTRVHAAGGICAAICAAPGLCFSRFGLLAGRTATCYPGFEENFPPDATFTTERVVVDGNIITSRSPGTAMEFSIALVRTLVGDEMATQLTRGMLVEK